jgi:hypothetical protein
MAPVELLSVRSMYPNILTRFQKRTWEQLFSHESFNVLSLVICIGDRPNILARAVFYNRKVIKRNINVSLSLLSGVMVSVLAIGPKVRGPIRGRGDGFLRAINIRSTPSFGREVKPEAPRRNILLNVKITWKNTSQGQILTHFAHSSGFATR